MSLDTVSSHLGKPGLAEKNLGGVQEDEADAEDESHPMEGAGALSEQAAGEGGGGGIVGECGKEDSDA